MAIVSAMVGLSVVPKATLIALASFANDDGTSCIPGQKKIAKCTGCSERTVRKNLAFLDQEGLITRDRRHTAFGFRTSDSYKLNVEAIKTYRHSLPVGIEDKPAVDKSAYRQNRSSLPANLVEPTGKIGKAYRHSLPDKNLTLSVDSVFDSVKDSVSLGELSAVPPNPHASAIPAKNAELAPPLKPVLEKAETESERQNRLAVEQQRQVRAAREFEAALKASTGNGATPVLGNSATTPEPTPTRPNEFDRSKQSYLDKAERRAARQIRKT